MAFDESEQGDDDDEQDNLEQTYLTFSVDAVEYAVPVAMVTEIVRLPKSYPVPDVPDFVRGVINLRGKVIPLLDVRGRFGLKDEPYTDRTVVVVLDLGDSATGLVVDAVSEVVAIDPREIEPLAGRAGEPRSLVSGIGKGEGGLRLMLDVLALVTIDPHGALPTYASPGLAR